MNSATKGMEKAIGEASRPKGLALTIGNSKGTMNYLYKSVKVFLDVLCPFSHAFFRTNQYALRIYRVDFLTYML
jgi:hypothetical protein